MSGRALATLVIAEVVMVETPVTESSIQAGGRTAHPGHARPSPGQEHRGRGEEYRSTWSDRIQVYADAKKYDVLRRIHNRDMLIWQIEEYLYPTSILGMIYHIRADAFIFFGL